MTENQILELQTKNGITGLVLKCNSIEEKKQRLKELFNDINFLAQSVPVGKLEVDSILAMVNTGEPILQILEDISNNFDQIRVFLRNNRLRLTKKTEDSPIRAVYHISEDFGLIENDILLDNPRLLEIGIFYTVLANYFEIRSHAKYNNIGEEEIIEQLREVLEQCRSFLKKLERYREDKKHLERTFRFVEETFEDSILRIAESDQEEKEVRSLASEIKTRSLEDGLFNSRMSETEFKQILTDFLLNYIRPVFSDYPEFSRFGNLYNRFLDYTWEFRFMIINDGTED